MEKIAFQFSSFLSHLHNIQMTLFVELDSQYLIRNYFIDDLSMFAKSQMGPDLWNIRR